MTYGIIENLCDDKNLGRNIIESAYPEDYLVKVIQVNKVLVYLLKIYLRRC